VGLALALGSVALVTLADPARSGAGGATGPLTRAGGPPTASPNSSSKAPEPSGPGAAVTRFASSPALVSQGISLYANGCASCHGALLQGQPGVAPSLIGVGAGPVDFYLSTGRMPLQAPRDEPERASPAYNRAQINALIAYVSKVGGGPPAPAAHPSAGDLAAGLHEFTLHCAGCHQIVGRGGLTLGAYVPNLQQATPLQLAEAVRMGPYLMPHFDAQQIDQHQLDSLARFVLWTEHRPDPGGHGGVVHRAGGACRGGPADRGANRVKEVSGGR
jgi:ubiquinol-cytochrome c reductase cytochrome c subunit